MKSILDKSKIYLHVVESAQHPAHSVYQDVLAHPPVQYMNHEFTKLSSTVNNKLSFASNILNTVKLPNVWRIKKNCNLIHSAQYLMLNRTPWVMDFEINAALTGFNMNRLNSSTCRFAIKKLIQSKHCKRILPWSEAAAKSLRTYLSDKKIAEKITVVHPSFTPEFRIKDLPKKRNTSTTEFLFAGKYFLPKGGKEALAVIEQLNKSCDVHLTIASDAAPELQKKYAKNKAITFLPWMPRKEYFEKHFSQADVFFLPTHYDTYGIQFLEAASLGIPVLATRTFAVPELVLHEKTGLLAQSPRISWFNKDYQIAYKNTHQENWQNYITNLAQKKEPALEKELFCFAKKLAEATTFRNRLGANAQKRFNKEFNGRKRNQLLRAVYEEALRR
ncbi:MAG: glycosyltransferase family 4 protein [Candidatus Woesearchaeota archaeon]|nr:glycosyltransferase family 4 protein [Candidatus Woesearchaeota archaeon]